MASHALRILWRVKGAERDRLGERGGRQRPILDELYRPFDDLPQLAHIPRPRIVAQHSLGSRLQALIA